MAKSAKKIVRKFVLRATFTYDGNGNTLTKVASAGTTTYNWDFENRLTSVVPPSSGGTVTFKYDPFGRRIQKASSAGVTNYLYDGSNSVAEIDQVGNLVARYAQDAGIDEPLTELRSGTVAFYEADGLGSVTSLSDTASSLVNTYTYDPFGNVAASTGVFTNPFQYTARDSDSEVGLRYYRARFYDPVIGRFVSEDPIRFNAKQVDFYTYASNNPIRFVDPFGTCAIQFDSVTRYHIECNSQYVLPKDKCACHCAYATDQAGCQDLCEQCFKKGLKPHELCMCSCEAGMKAAGIQNPSKDCEKVCKGVK